MVTEQPVLSFAGLLRRLRDEAGLTQDELAEAAQVSQRAISDLERGINRTARKDTALLLAGALGLAGPARDLFVTVARGQAPATQVLATARGEASGGFADRQAGLAWLLRAVTDSPYRGLAAFEEQFARQEADVGAKLKESADALAGGATMAQLRGQARQWRGYSGPEGRQRKTLAAWGDACEKSLVFVNQQQPVDPEERATVTIVPAYPDAVPAILAFATEHHLTASLEHGHGRLSQ